MILPLRVFGKASVNRISSGRASAPISLTTWTLSSCRSSSEGAWPVSSVTNAEIPCPLISSGLPTTAASATFGWLTRALSISIVESRCPATLSTSSTRPRIQKFPASSFLAPSPVK